MVKVDAELSKTVNIKNINCTPLVNMVPVYLLISYNGLDN